MQAEQILKITGARVLTKGVAEAEDYHQAFASDLMSDVLRIDASKLLLITGLNNLQTIRTAEMAEIRLILFGRGKHPSKDMIELAEKEGMMLMVSEKSLFHLSGLLFKEGIGPVY